MASGKAAAWLEIGRPFSWTASVVPVLVGSALAWKDGAFSWPIFLVVLLASVALQAGTNVINELYDVKNRVDTLESPRASRALVEGRLTEREAFWGGLALFGFVALVGLWLVNRSAIHELYARASTQAHSGFCTSPSPRPPVG